MQTINNPVYFLLLLGKKSFQAQLKRSVYLLMVSIVVDAVAVAVFCVGKYISWYHLELGLLCLLVCRSRGPILTKRIDERDEYKRSLSP